MIATISSTRQPAGLLRRLAAALYDSLLLLALWMVDSAIWLALNGGEPIDHDTLLYPFYLASLALVAFAFFGGFWVYAGQTLGMRAWRLRVQNRDGANPTPRQALLRFVGAMVSWLALGIGFLWSLVDRERLAWHDRWSDTRLLHEPKSAGAGDT